MEEAILSMKNITKIYSNGFVANEGVNFSVTKGEIHALVGENGAGKSTLMKVLFGEEMADEGEIFLKGKPIKLLGSAHAIENGIGMVHQHFMLVPSLTVAENIVMGIEPRKGIFIDHDKMIKMAEGVAQKYHFDIDVRETVDNLAVGIKQKIEILKALLRGADILILDEPTAVLTPQETSELFVQLKRLREEGHTVIFISHKLNEIKELCDRITVLRNGRTVGHGNVSELSERKISKMMIGRDATNEVEKKKAQPKETVLKVRDLVVKGENGYLKIKGLNLDLKAGEILGVAGIEGSGQRELAEVITGLNQYYSGKVTLLDEVIKGRTIRQLRELGVAHVPEDRMTYGVAKEKTIEENLFSDKYYRKDYCRKGSLERRWIAEESEKLIKSYLIKCDSRNQEVGMLSGGNIQKVVAAREFHGNLKLVVANQPTRGIDVGAPEFVRKKIIELRDQGVAVLLISADLNEVLTVADSLIVMADGKIKAYYQDMSRIKEEELGEYMLGLKSMTEDEIGRMADGKR